MEVPDVDSFFSWIAEREIGRLRDSAPLQCLAVSAEWDPDAFARAEDMLDDLMGDMDVGFPAGEQGPPVRHTESDISSAVDMLFNLLPTSDGTISVLGAEEMLLTLSEFECTSASNVPDSTERNSTKRPKFDTTAVSRSAPANVIAPATVPVSVPVAAPSAHDNLKSRFKTAKRQFGEEGGVLEQNNSSNKRTELNPPAQSDGKKELPDALKDFDKALVQKIESDILHHGQAVTFDDISGLEFAKKCVQELVCWPMLRPDIFTGLRALPKGLLLFGPPGTGKTLIGKAIATQTGATFFSISSSSLTSKWIGEGEASVKTLFAVANYYQPSVVFIDEIDSLLCQRSSEENEATRRIKTEFLVQLDGAGTSSDAQVVIIGATNRPQELDDAARRRLVKRLYVPLPDKGSRFLMLKNLLKNNRNCMSANDFETVADRTDGFSGADISALCTEAAMCPLRELASRNMGGLQCLRESEVPPISLHHFTEARREVSASVSQVELQKYVDWNEQYGTYRRME